MKGHILLEGGAEFGGQMAEVDQRAIQLAGGSDARIGIIPTAAAPDHNDKHAGRNAVNWFSQLGATHVGVIPLVDRPSAEETAISEALHSCRLIYMLGGFPDYLGETLSGSLAWKAMVAAYREGAVLGGSSAGAMVLCRHFYDPGQRRVLAGLGLLQNSCVIPHHNSFGRKWLSALVDIIPGDLLIGIDERTGMIDDNPNGGWTVYGAGSVSLYRGEKQPEVHRRGDTFFVPGSIN